MGYHWKKSKISSQTRCEIINSGDVVPDTNHNSYFKGKIHLLMELNGGLQGRVG